MKPEFEEYLLAINMPQTFRERINSLLPYAKLLCPEDLERIFVTDYVNQDGTREYENLFFFSQSFVVEAKQFVTNNDVDIANVKEGIYYIKLTANEYDLKNPTEKSRVNLQASLSDGAPQLRLEMKASKENCDYLIKILETVFKPNLL